LTLRSGEQRKVSAILKKVPQGATGAKVGAFEKIRISIQ
jgi:hypothetical protein